MGRSFFPTYSLNRFGVRDTDQRATLGSARPFDSEPNIRAANNPTGPMLGAVRAFVGDGPLPVSDLMRLPISPGRPTSPIFWNGSPAPMPGPIPVITPQPIIVGPFQYTPLPPIPAGPLVLPPVSSSGGGNIATPQYPVISSSGGGGAVVAPPAQPPASALPVSQQVGPTPTVTVPTPSPSSVLLISSGGGTQTPSTPTVVAPAPSTTTGLVEGISAWLGGTTSIFNYNVPNALIAGVVVLGFAWLSSSGKKR